jgi:hypothetical protein
MSAPFVARGDDSHFVRVVLCAPRPESTATERVPSEGRLSVQLRKVRRMAGKQLHGRRGAVLDLRLGRRSLRGCTNEPSRKIRCESACSSLANQECRGRLAVPDLIREFVGEIAPACHLLGAARRKRPARGRNGRVRRQGRSDPVHPRRKPRSFRDQPSRDSESRAAGQFKTSGFGQDRSRRPKQWKRLRWSPANEMESLFGKLPS